jgi:hypothetical protein
VVQDKAKVGRKVVVKPYRKHGNGGFGGGRKGQTGKRGIIYEVVEDKEPQELMRFEEPTFGALKKKLFGPGCVPTYVTINKSGETVF